MDRSLSGPDLITPARISSLTLPPSKLTSIILPPTVPQHDPKPHPLPHHLPGEDVPDANPAVGAAGYDVPENEKRAQHEHNETRLMIQLHVRRVKGVTLPRGGQKKGLGIMPSIKATHDCF